MQSFNLNLISATEIIRGAYENLKANKGSIVMFSTVAARKGFMNHSIISSAKAAVEGLTVSLAAEFAPHVRVNCIAPSLSNSKTAAPMLKNEKMAESIARNACNEKNRKWRRFFLNCKFFTKQRKFMGNRPNSRCRWRKIICRMIIRIDSFISH